MASYKPKKKKTWTWEKIATEMYEAMGCSCCADYDRLLEAKTRYREKKKGQDDGGQ